MSRIRLEGCSSSRQVLERRLTAWRGEEQLDSQRLDTDLRGQQMPRLSHCSHVAVIECPDLAVWTRPVLQLVVVAVI